jgi:hypothetical protein
MGILQKVIAALLAAAIIGSIPLIAIAGLAGPAGCDTVAAAGSDDGCCSDGVGMNDSACSIVCAASSIDCRGLLPRFGDPI